MSVLKTIDADDDAATAASEPTRAAGVSIAPWRTLADGIGNAGAAWKPCRPLAIQHRKMPAATSVQAVDLRSYEEVKQEQQRQQRRKGLGGLIAAADRHKLLILGALVLMAGGGYVLHQQGVFAAVAAQLQAGYAAAGRLWAVAANLVRCAVLLPSVGPAMAACACCPFLCPTLCIQEDVRPNRHCPLPCVLQQAALPPHPRQRERAPGDHLAAAGLSCHGAPDLQDPGRLPRARLPGEPTAACFTVSCCCCPPCPSAGRLALSVPNVARLLIEAWLAVPPHGAG
jgi:hypothetical protein